MSDPLGGESPDGRGSFAANLVLFVLAMFPYGIWIGQVYPIRIFTFSLFATVLPFSLMLIAAVSLSSRGRPLALRLTLLGGFIASAVVLLRMLVGVGAGMAQEMSQARWLITLPLLLLVPQGALATGRFRQRARHVLLCNYLLGALMGVLYSLGIWSVRISSAASDGTTLVDSLAGARTRASGAWLNPNAFGAFLLLGVMFVLFSARLSFWLKVPFVGLLVAGIGTSGSRWPFLAALLVMAVYLVLPGRVAGSRPAVLKRLVPIVIGVAALGSYGANTASRFSDDYQASRLIKSAAGWQALTTGPTAVLIGANPEDLLIDPRPEFQFSDNGWLQMALSVGIPATAVMLVLIWRHVRPPRRSAERWLMLIVFAGTMSVNNANLWEPWLMYAGATYWLSPRGAAAHSSSRLGHRRGADARVLAQHRG